MEIKLKDTFERTGLGSWISWESLKEILTGFEQGFNKSNELTHEITGFIVNENGIQIQKEYK